MKTEYLIKIGSVAKWLGPFFAAGALLNAEVLSGQNKIERLGRSWEMHHGF